MSPIDLKEFNTKAWDELEKLRNKPGYQVHYLFQAGFSQMNDSERIKFCDTLGVTNRYTGYRHNLNRGNLDPVRIGYAWLDQEPNQPPQPKWTPEPKWTPPSCQPDPICNTEPTSCAQLKCDFKNVLKPGPTNLQKSDPPCECDTTFKPLPKLIPQIGCDDVNGIIASPDPRPKSQPESVTPATCSLYVTKCVPVARQKSNEKANVPEFTQQFHYEYERPQVDLCEYIRKPRQQCYIRNGGGRKADLETWVPPQLPSNSFKPHRPLCRPGTYRQLKSTYRFYSNRATLGRK